MQKGTIAPEANTENPPMASVDGGGDDDAVPLATDTDKIDEEFKKFQDILKDDNGTVNAVNKDTPDDDIEENTKDNTKYPAVVDEAVLSEAPVDDSVVKDATAPSSDPPFPTSFPQYPPSFFTDDRGNLKAVNMVVRNPCLIFSLIIGLCILISFLLQVTVFRAAAEEGTIPITVPVNEFDLGDLRSIQYDSFRLAKDEVQKMKGELANSLDKNVQKQSELAAIAYWVFEADRDNTDKGVFGTADSIQGMKDAYDIFLDSPEFKDYCVLDYRTPVAPGETRKCRTPLSPLTMYYASEWDEVKAGDVIEQLKDPAKVELFNSLATCLIQKQFCEKKPEATPEEESWTLQLGDNIKSITAKWDMEGPLVPNFDQVTEFASYMIELDMFKGTVDFGFDDGFSTSNLVSHFSRGIVFWGGPLADVGNETSKEDAEKIDETEGDQRKDFIKANYLDKMNEQSEKGTHDEINSYYFMTTLIGDVIIDIVTKDAMLAIFSFVFVIIWLRVNTKSWFLAWVGFFEIAVSIPIAWFIFTVVFQIKYFASLNTLALFIVAAIGADDIFIFMDAYKQSQYHPEILVDLETRMSWVYRRTGTAMAITSATTCAAFLCTLITPLASLQSFGIFAAFVILIDYVLVMTLFCTAVVIYHNRYENSACFGCCCPCGLVDPSNTEEARLALEGNEEIQRDRISEFFKVKVAGFIKVPLHRLILGVLFLTWFAIAIWQMSLIEATKESEQFLDEDHPLQKSVTLLNTHFPTADDDLGLKVHFVVGVDEIDRTGVNLLLDPENYGSPNFVAGFDFNEKCQEDLVTFCDELKTAPKYKDLIKRKSGLGSVYCFVEELAAYNVKGDLTGDEYCNFVRQGEWKNKNWQVNPNDLSEIMPRFLKERSCFDENSLETTSERYQDEIGWNGLNLMYASISTESNVLDPFGVGGEAQTRGEYDQFVDIAKEQEKIISQSCGGAVTMTDLDGIFVFMNNQSIYVRSAIQSAVLGVAIAFGVLLISTRVFHLALFASITIMSVLASVVGTMVMLGWTLGSIESTLIGIIAGFSVDYVVHLAHAYEIAKGDTYDRITEAFSDLGISVFNGMITSVAASIPLFFCQLQFFAKFGTFLCLTIAYSWIFANFGFMTLLAQLKIPLKEKGCRL
mmetsp:Transcript_29797/g.54761  ORF Transcript_29797/g.54761 Transcript_29797/m.54761 type:complete len:1140 (-) Transcript_29797:156-3575(-)|eukprot:CAMPEP_0196142508 /NCGR_PEP_ID=MMETSP0910-20130528/11648_1 /TAXON_ID=49265 /ORGANISM="Thalassiosira rotula, Strain GSO102" /LENGTH=1139 /DNA_ID=CAMNT_0041403821 /DNA_START=40 /DNA_END=3459 /DNA_ORIENTATION=-